MPCSTTRASTVNALRSGLGVFARFFLSTLSWKAVLDPRFSVCEEARQDGKKSLGWKPLHPPESPCRTTLFSGSGEFDSPPGRELLFTLPGTKLTTDSF